MDKTSEYLGGTSVTEGIIKGQQGASSFLFVFFSMERGKTQGWEGSMVVYLGFGKSFH